MIIRVEQVKEVPEESIFEKQVEEAKGSEAVKNKAGLHGTWQSDIAQMLGALEKFEQNYKEH